VPSGRLASGWRSQPTYHASVHAARVLLATITLASTLSACGFFGGAVVQDGPPVPAGPLGPVLPGQEGGPPVECRGVPLQECQSFGFGAEPNLLRVIVTCTSVCTPLEGDVRIDALQPDGTTRSMGQGSYSGAMAEPQPQVIPEPAVTPPPS
jgi:hypothetical protein